MALEEASNAKASADGYWGWDWSVGEPMRWKSGGALPRVAATLHFGWLYSCFC